jgi:hypothetical protein
MRKFKVSMLRAKLGCIKIRWMKCRGRLGIISLERKGSLERWIRNLRLSMQSRTAIINRKPASNIGGSILPNSATQARQPPLNHQPSATSTTAQPTMHCPRFATFSATTPSPPPPRPSPTPPSKPSTAIIAASAPSPSISCPQPP